MGGWLLPHAPGRQAETTFPPPILLAPDSTCTSSTSTYRLRQVGISTNEGGLTDGRFSSFWLTSTSVSNSCPEQKCSAGTLIPEFSAITEHTDRRRDRKTGTLAPGDLWTERSRWPGPAPRSPMRLAAGAATHVEGFGGGHSTSSHGGQRERRWLAVMITFQRSSTLARRRQRHASTGFWFPAAGRLD